MIQRLVSVKDFRIFQHWKDLENHRFGRRTLVFGANGSGKSTLSDMFSAVEARRQGLSADERLAGIRFEVGPGRKAIPADSDEMPRVVVFNRRYVELNLRKALSGAGHGVPLYVLGERDASLDEQIATKESLHSILTDQVREAGDALSKAMKAEAKCLDNVKADVEERLHRYNPKYNRSGFDKRKAKKLLQGKRHPLSNEQLRLRQSELQLSSSDIPSSQTMTAPEDMQRLEGRLYDIAEHEVLSRTVDELAHDSVLSNWVEAGLPLHSSVDTCGFCGSEIPTGRIDELRAHFDDSYKALMRKCDAAREDILRCSASIASAQEGIRLLNGLDPDLDDAIAEAKEDVEAYRMSAHAWLETASALVSERQGSPFGRVEWSPPVCPSSDVWDALRFAVEAANQRFSERRENVAKIREEAEHQILHHLAAKHGTEHDRLGGELEHAQDNLKSLKERLELLNTDLRTLKGQLGSTHDGATLADNLTRDLQGYLGHGQLTVRFSNAGGVAGYAFLRNGVTAKDLSEGERNAIALLYFLRSLRSVEIVGDLPSASVVIDDPVSSLDQDNVISAFSYILEHTTNSDGSLACGQLLILTHNFDFFRIWKEQFKSAAQRDLNDARDRNMSVKDLTSRRVALLELRVSATRDGGKVVRTPRLREIGVDTRALLSEYYFLFERACEATSPEKEGLLPLAGNSTRRLLEGFIRFKAPDEVNFTRAARKLGDAADVPNETVTRVVKALHGASHRTELDIRSSHHESSILDDIRAALAFMQRVDGDHFEGMCRATHSVPELGDELLLGLVG